MYIPKYFENKNLEEVEAFIKQNSFGILVSSANDKPTASHIPLELEHDKQGKDVIYGHVALANPQWKQLNSETEVLVIYNGPQAYVSSSWYGVEEVPTWNYIAVHVYGKIEILDEDELRFSLKKLMEKYEAGSANPVKMEELSEKTMKQIRGIVGFKIHITEIQAAYKLSQNRNKEDHKSIVEHLNERGENQDASLAEAMNKAKTQNNNSN